MKDSLKKFLKTLWQDISTITSVRQLLEIALTPLYRNAFYLMLVTMVTSLLGFFFWMIVARYYTEVEVGYSSAIISAISLLTVISMVGLNSLIIRFLPQSTNPGKLINSSLTLGGIISIAAAIIFIAGLDFWSPALLFIRENTFFIAAFVSFTVMWTLSTMINSVLTAGRQTFYVLVKSTIFAGLKLPLPIVFVAFWHSFGIVASWGIAGTVAVLASFIFFIPAVVKRYRPRPSLTSTTLKNSWHYSARSYVVNLLSVSIGFVLPILVLNLLDSKHNAYFYIAWTLAGATFAIPRATSVSLFTEGSHFEEKLRENLVKSLKFTYLLLIPSVTVLCLMGKWILLAFGPSYSQNSLELLWVLCISSLPMAFNFLYTSMLRVENRLRELIILWSSITTSLLLISYLTVPIIGILGIGYTWLGINTAVALYILLKKRFFHR